VQLPLEPLVTSLNNVGCDHANCGVDVPARPVSAKIEATSGELTLVPPTWTQPVAPADEPPYVSYVATPVFGSAIAERSASIRNLQPVSVCHEGFATYALQPLPLSLHAVSVQPRVVPVALVSVVPPTAVTYCEVAGKLAP
jgi:hypothetical protein